MNILIHSCCGLLNCGFEEINHLGHSFSSFFYNPNIHPFTEHRARFSAWEELCQKEGIPMLSQKDYPLEEWLREVALAPDKRCEYCYKSRLSLTAKTAAQEGFDAFTTTLKISPYQNQNLIDKIGKEEGEKYNIDFLNWDFRPFFRSGQKKAKENGLYMQKYCGCIYSEKERYLKKPKPGKA